MILCPVCHAANHHLATICTGCGSFIQQKVDNLDLFATLWKLVESPRRGFRTIALARHKNYVVFLSSIAGVGFLFTIFWFLNIGEVLTGLVSLMVVGMTGGLVVGPVLVLIFAMIVKTTTFVASTSATFKNIFSISSYALLPVVLTVFSILPIELLTFGVFMFSKNPSPSLLKPFSYFVILGLDAAFGLWTIILFVIGMKVLMDTGWRKTLLVSLASLCAFLFLAGETIAFLSSKIIPRA